MHQTTIDAGMGNWHLSSKFGRKIRRKLTRPVRAVPRIPVPKDAQRADGSEKDVAHAPEDGPLAAEVAGGGGVAGRRGRREVDEERGDAHEGLRDGVALRGVSLVLVWKRGGHLPASMNEHAAVAAATVSGEMEIMMAESLAVVVVVVEDRTEDLARLRIGDSGGEGKRRNDIVRDGRRWAVGKVWFVFG